MFNCCDGSLFSKTNIESQLLTLIKINCLFVYLLLFFLFESISIVLFCSITVLFRKCFRFAILLLALVHVNFSFTMCSVLLRFSLSLFSTLKCILCTRAEFRLFDSTRNPSVLLNTIQLDCGFGF